MTPFREEGARVDASVAWTGSIWFDGHMELWNDRFFRRAALDGAGVFDAAVYAEQKVYLEFGSYAGVDTSVVYGASVKIKPPAYGS